MNLEKDVEKYWTHRSTQYAKDKESELHTFKKDAWEKLILRYAPQKQRMKLLDIGTGPGFFAILMAKLGHEVFAIDYTQDMIERAKETAILHHTKITFQKMDAHQLDFPDNTFDCILTRNLTWTLKDPIKAYKSWHAVLKKGGRLLNFDGNWYNYLFDPHQQRSYLADRQKVAQLNMPDAFASTDVTLMENIAKQLPLSREKRPLWDVDALWQLGFKKIFLEQNISDAVWDDEQKVNFASMPMFMIGAEKASSL